MGQSVRRSMRHVSGFAPFIRVSGRRGLMEAMSADLLFGLYSPDVDEKPLVLQAGEEKSR
jgi:hypothetical protein